MKRLLLGAIVLLSGCATMVNKSTERIPVRSTPAGAVVSVECGDAPVFGGTTPTVITVPRAASPCAITLAKEGYAETRVEFRRVRSRVASANRVAAAPVGVLFGLVGFVISSDRIDPETSIGIGWDIGTDLASMPGDKFDEAHGGAFKQVPGEVDVTLEPAEAPPAAPPLPPRGR